MLRAMLYDVYLFTLGFSKGAIKDSKGAHSNLGF
jgi:hypothetical protein